jgi:hypothetical protein
MNLLAVGRRRRVCETQLSEMSDKYSTRRTDLAMNTYPSIGNPKFHELLQKMRQMYVDKLSPISRTSTREDESTFETPTISKTYMSPGTGYNGFYWYTTSVGKTCTAVAIEMYHATMSKPAIILTGVALKAQWKGDCWRRKSAICVGRMATAAVLCGCTTE